MKTNTSYQSLQLICVCIALLPFTTTLAGECRPNIIVLLSDDLGWKDIGCYDGPVKTPTLDQLASGGMRFTNFYSGAAVCSPSRAVLLTGRTNVRASIYSWINDDDQRSHLPKAEVTIAEVLQRGGYATAHFGKWHLGLPSNKFPDKPTPADHGFDYWFATGNNAQPSHHNPRNFIRNGKPVGMLEGYACDLVVNEAVSWLENRSDDDRPFLVNIWFHEPHAPLAAPEGLVRQYGEQSDPAAVYSATIANTDQAINRLVEKLHEIDEPENTLISWNGDAAALARLISLVGNHERAIYASTGTRKREQMMYAKRIKQYGNKDNAKSRCESDRYHLLNLTHLTRGKNRIEFRAFGGTLNKTKVVGYLMMVLGLVELALNTKRCSEWDYIKKEGTKSCWDRPGAGLGETEINRLFYRLGWTKGWYKGALRDKVYGVIASETKPEWKKIKTKLLELARKYDRAA